MINFFFPFLSFLFTIFHTTAYKPGLQTCMFVQSFRFRQHRRVTFPSSKPLLVLLVLNIKEKQKQGKEEPVRWTFWCWCICVYSRDILCNFGSLFLKILGDICPQSEDQYLKLFTTQESRWGSQITQNQTVMTNTIRDRFCLSMFTHPNNGFTSCSPFLPSKVSCMSHC